MDAGSRWTPPTPSQLQGLLPGYQVLELIARGGMGAVYRARQISLDRPVAVKILPSALWHEDEDYSERFRNEARVMARLSHPGMIAVHDFGSMPDGQLYFIMEYVQGTDVGQMLVKSGKLAPLHALAIAAHVCDALAYAHKHGVIHRDIKPGNIMVDLEGRVKVADFGLARVAAQESASAQSTTTMGTPDYVAPEALVVGVMVDARADLYALGVTLYEMITGKVPGNVFVPLSKCVPGLDPRFDKIIQRALQRERTKRYQSAAELRADLDRIVNTPQEKPRPSLVPVRPAITPPPPVRPRSSHGPAWSVVAAAVTVAIAAVALFLWKPASDAPDHRPSTERPVASAPSQPAVPAAPSPETTAPAPPVTAPAPVVSSPSSKPPAPAVLASIAPSPQPVTLSPVLPVSTSSPSPATDVIKRLRELDTSFQAALERDVTNAFNAAFADLSAKYIASVDQAQSSAWALGRIPEAQLFVEEKKRMEARQPIPADDTGIPESLRKLRVGYRHNRSRMEEDKKKTKAGLYDKYLDVLAAYQLELTKAGKLEDAVRVTDKRREIALAAAHLER